MNAYDFVHLSLLALGGEIKGRTKLQKTIYFLGVLADSLEDLGYRPRFYGPYSAEVGAAVDRLRGLGFLDQNMVGGGAVDPAGFEVVRYDFRLNDQGTRIARAKAKKHPEEWQKVQEAVDVLQKAKEHDYMKMSIAAKTYFMLGERRGSANIHDLVSLASKFGWSVTAEEVREASRFLERLGLVSLDDED